MKVSQMMNSRGNKVANQFLIHGIETYFKGKKRMERAFTIFQSYDSVIAKSYYSDNKYCIELDKNYWDYSVTTGKYRNQFLGETKKETQKKIDSGEYKLVDLN